MVDNKQRHHLTRMMERENITRMHNNYNERRQNILRNKTAKSLFTKAAAEIHTDHSEIRNTETMYCPITPPGRYLYISVIHLCTLLQSLHIFLFFRITKGSIWYITGLSGAINVTTNSAALPGMLKLEKLFSALKPGGHYRPENCTSRHRVAIIVPYRNRADHLRIFLFNLHSLLPRQQLGRIMKKYWLR